MTSLADFHAKRYPSFIAYAKVGSGQRTNKRYLIHGLPSGSSHPSWAKIVCAMRYQAQIAQIIRSIAATLIKTAEPPRLPMPKQVKPSRRVRKVKASTPFCFIAPIKKMSVIAVNITKNQPISVVVMLRMP